MTNQEDFIAKWTSDTNLLASLIVAPMPCCYYCAYCGMDKCEGRCNNLVCFDGVVKWLKQKKE